MINGFDLSTISDLYVGSTQASAIYYGSNLIWSSPPPHDYSQDYLTIEALEDDCILSFGKVGSVSNKTIEFSFDKLNWISVTSSSSSSPEYYGRNIADLSQGNIVYVRGLNSQYSTGQNNYNCFLSTKKIKIYGNIMSLIYGDNFYGQTTITQTSALLGIFRKYKGQGVADAENLVLPATTLTTDCYNNLFYDCSNLVKAPIMLPSTTLAKSCYKRMFYGCTSLTTAPELPATDLSASGEQTYHSMFYNCSSLTTAPALPATTLVKACYQYMFSGCSSLNYVKCLATDISASNCTLNWLNNVASTGTFVKDPNMTGWTTGISGIPSGWTIHDIV